jgi:hypothetical protein
MVPQGSLTTSNNDAAQWRTAGVKQPGEVPTRTEFPDALVTQLREAAQKQKSKPWQNATSQPAAKKGAPLVAVAGVDLPVMAQIKNGNLVEKGAFLRRHFPTWLAYQQAHGLSQSKMQALVGVAPSVWHNHKLLYAAHPERYGENGVPLGQKSKPGAEPVILPEVLSSTAVARVQAFMGLAQELREMGAQVQASVSWQVEVEL